MQTIWFKRKTYGWGWVPASWQGWLITVVYLVLVVLFSFSVDEMSTTRELLFTCIIPIMLLTSTLIRIAYVKGERPRWQWGDKK